MKTASEKRKDTIYRTQINKLIMQIVSRKNDSVVHIPYEMAPIFLFQMRHIPDDIYEKGFNYLGKKFKFN